MLEFPGSNNELPYSYVLIRAHLENIVAGLPIFKDKTDGSIHTAEMQLAY